MTDPWIRPAGHDSHGQASARCLLLLVTVFPLATPLAAFEVLGKWPLSRLSFVFNPNFPDQSLSGTPEEQIDIILCAARTWEMQTRAGFEMRYLGETAINRARDDGVNAVFWTDQDGDGALAVTVVDVDVDTNHILSFDIIFYSRTNGAALSWSGPGEPPGGTFAFDIGGVATHELGHALGLSHSAVPSATMFLSAGSRGLALRSLDPDDQAGVEFLYGRVDPADPGVEVTGVVPDLGSPQGGEEVLITGSNFTYDSDTVLRIDGMTVASSRWTVESCDLIRVSSMPPHASGTVDITISNSVGTTTVVGAYRYGSSRPLIISVDPDRGPLEGGISITIKGEGFEESALGDIDGQPLEDQLFVDAETIVGTLPAGRRTGPVDVRVVQGADIATLSDGFFYNGYRLEIATTAAPPASTGVPVNVLASSPDPLGAVSFGLLFDPSVLAIADITVAGTEAAAAEFARANIDNASGVATFGLVMSFAGRREIPAGNQRLIARVLADTDPTAAVGSTATLELASDVGSPPIRLIFTPAGTADEFTPDTEDGAIRINEGVVFTRGDANDDTIVNISDALKVLDFLFEAEPAGRCHKALDANDDGSINISDPVYVLAFLFASGKRIPPPYPEAGIDPTPDGLPCS